MHLSSVRKFRPPVSHPEWRLKVRLVYNPRPPDNMHTRSIKNKHTVDYKWVSLLPNLMQQCSNSLAYE